MQAVSFRGQYLTSSDCQRNYCEAWCGVVTNGREGQASHPFAGGANRDRFDDTGKSRASAKHFAFIGVNNIAHRNCLKQPLF
jgi:hypothetical protein